MISHDLSHSFSIGNMHVRPVHIRIEQLRPVIPAHRHSHSSYEIHYTARGKGTTTIGDVPYSIRENTLYITGPDIVHSQWSDPSDPILEYCLYLHCKPGKESEPLSSAAEFFLNTKFWIGEDTEDVFSVLKQIIEEQEQQGEGFEEMTEALLRRAIVLLTRTYRKQSPKDEEKKLPKAATLAANQYPIIEDAFFYQYRTLELDDLAEILHLSHRQTQRILKEHYGMTFTQKRAEARMAAASQMLKRTDLNLQEIAERVGFSSAEHLSNAFRRTYQTTPGAYRRKIREESS